MDTIVFFDDDLDGWGAAWAAREALGEEAKYVCAGHDDELPAEEIPDESAKIYCLDYVAQPETFKSLAETHDVTVIDHHKSLLNYFREEGAFIKFDVGSVEDAYQGPAGWFDTYDQLFDDSVLDLHINLEHSAATLAWHHFHQSEPPKLLRHIEDRDLWNWEMQHTEEILLGLESAGLNLDTIGQFARRPERLISAGSAVKSYRQGLVQDIADNASVRLLDVDGWDNPIPTAMAVSPTLQSEIADLLLTRHPESSMALVYSFTSGLGEDQSAFCSLRSREDGLDVSQVAEALGGGGHADAAGCAVGVDVLAENVQTRPDDRD